jgi:hypothetical protein
MENKKNEDPIIREESQEKENVGTPVRSSGSSAAAESVPAKRKIKIKTLSGKIFDLEVDPNVE